MSEMSSKAKKLFDEFNYSQTVYHAFLASGINNEYIEKKRKTRDAKRESFEEYVVGLEARIAELEAENTALKQHPQPIEFWSDEKKELYRRNESRTIKSGREEGRER